MATMRGFTIIEVVLVLAIAGLIFLMVFIALPAMQRSQKDTQRRDDMSRFMAAIQSYQANNSSKIPKTADEFATFLSKYLSMTTIEAAKVSTPDSIPEANNEFKDPDGTPYGVKINPKPTTNDAAVTISSTDHLVYFYPEAKCGSTSEQVSKGSGKSSYAIFYKLEGSGLFCADNN